MWRTVMHCRGHAHTHTLTHILLNSLTRRLTSLPSSSNTLFPPSPLSISFFHLSPSLHFNPFNSTLLYSTLLYSTLLYSTLLYFTLLYSICSLHCFPLYIFLPPTLLHSITFSLPPFHSTPFYFITILPSFLPSQTWGRLCASHRSWRWQPRQHLRLPRCRTSLRSGCALLLLLLLSFLFLFYFFFFPRFPILNY